LFSISIADGIPELIKIFPISWVFQILDSQSRQSGKDRFEQDRAICMAGYLLKMLPPDEQDKILLPFFQILKLKYPGKTDRIHLSTIVIEIAKEDFFQIVNKQSQALSIFGPALPNILNYIETNFEFIRLCVIAELTMANIMANRGRNEQFQYQSGMMKLPIEL
jgi:hypothetical protein